MGLCSSAEEDEKNVPISPPEKNTKFKNEEQLAKLLKSIPLLTRMSQEDRRKIVVALKEETISEGEDIIRQGDVADKFYIIKKGKAAVILNGEKVNELAEGEFFGEQGFVNKNVSKRKASIRAIGGSLFALSRDEFYKIFDEKQMRRLFPKRQAISGASSNMMKKQVTISKPSNAVTTKTMDDKKMIRHALETDNLMKTILGDDQVQNMLEEMWKIDVKVGKDIIKEGDKGDNFYIVISGRFGVYKSSEDGKGDTRVAERNPGQSFGGIALLYNCARNATVRCEEDASLWAIDRYTFKRISSNVSAHKLDEYEKFLSKVNGFNQLTKFERTRIAEALEEVKYKDGDVIIKEGDNGDSFYLLKKGYVVATKVIEGKEKKVMDYADPGGFFGERAILRDCKRAATCIARGPTVCLMLKRDVFELLLGPLHDLMERDMDAKYSLANKKPETTIENDGAKYRTNYKLSHLRTIGILGKGSFGSVKLVDVDGKRYALKAVGKQRVFSLGQQEHIMNERDIMLQIHHPFIVVLYQTFQDTDFLYFLLEPSLGGELFSVLREKSYFKQDEARFYAATVILVFEYLHSRDIIYRDLKPENLLLDSRGYLKVTDFGFAKVVKDRTSTLCGTPDYLAPEIISHISHGKGVDWWTLGILCYEMLASYPPFYDQDPRKVYAKIMLAKLKFPRGFNKNAEALIRGLLKAKPSMRLGVILGGAQKVKDQAWFKNFSFEKLLAGEMKAPIVIPVDDKLPLQNFEEYDEYSDTEPYKQDQKLFENFDST